LGAFHFTVPFYSHSHVGSVTSGSAKGADRAELKE